MSNDDKYGIGAGLMALGLAAGIILLGQLTYNKKAEDELAKSATVSADSGKVPLGSGNAQADNSAAKPSILYRMIPHRELNVPEAIFDGLVCVLALPAGVFFFISAFVSGSAEQETEKKAS